MLSIPRTSKSIFLKVCCACKEQFTNETLYEAHISSCNKGRTHNINHQQKDYNFYEPIEQKVEKDKILNIDKEEDLFEEIDRIPKETKTVNDEVEKVEIKKPRNKKQNNKKTKKQGKK